MTELAAELVEELCRRGVPGGYWLSEIAVTRRAIEDAERALGACEQPEARRALRQADDLLRRLDDAIVRSLREERG